MMKDIKKGFGLMTGAVLAAAMFELLNTIVKPKGDEETEEAKETENNVETEEA